MKIGGIIVAEMPTWVNALANHPLVVTFPMPDVDVVESSLKVELITEITDGQTTLSGIEKSYSTSKTEEASHSVADIVAYLDLKIVAESSAVLQFQNVKVTNVPSDLTPITTQAGTIAIAACQGDFNNRAVPE